MKPNKWKLSSSHTGGVWHWGTSWRLWPSERFHFIEQPLKSSYWFCLWGTFFFLMGGNYVTCLFRFSFIFLFKQWHRPIRTKSAPSQHTGIKREVLCCSGIMFLCIFHGVIPLISQSFAKDSFFYFNFFLLTNYTSALFLARPIQITCYELSTKLISSC